jgi:hypothetical protein
MELPIAAPSSVPGVAVPTPFVPEPESTAPPSSIATPALEPTLGTVTIATTPAMPVATTPTSAVIVVPITQMPETNQQRWRAQQQDRKVNNPPRTYIAQSPVTLWWYDPLTSQAVPIGTISGEFPAQAEFILRGDQQAGLEVPYVINRDFGLTAISGAVVERMKAAGYSQSVEAYVVQTADILPK